MKDDADKLARALKVLSVGTRVRMIALLKGRSLCVNALAARLGVTQGAVSQHLRILRDAGLVLDEKRGYYVHYRLNEPALAAWRERVDKLLDPVHGAGAATKTETEGDRPCAIAASRRRRAARSRRS
jgi:DNA-binding transcriptional ArsR family regulator